MHAQILAGTTGLATVDGTITEPAILARIHPRLPHPQEPSLLMIDWVKQRCNARWVAAEQSWRIHGLGSLTPEQTLAEAGITVDWSTCPEHLRDAPSLNALAMPLAKLHGNGRLVMVRHRLAGYDLTKELLGAGAVWDKERELFWTYVADVLDKNGDIRPGVLWPEDAIAAAYQMRTLSSVPETLAPLARHLSAALHINDIPGDQIRRIAPAGLPVTGREPYDYQKAGALAVAAGRSCLFDEPGLGKSLQALLAVRMRDARRTIIVCPPLLTTNWAREAGMTGFGSVAVFRAGRKEPALPDEGVVIIADSMLAARPATAERLRDWAPDEMIVDEAHRLKTIGSKRSEAVLNVAIRVRNVPIALTGTPIFAAPHELVPVLELTRMLAPVFGGRGPFLEDFCTQDRFNGWHARKSALPRLKALLEHYVWVRRRKRDALPQLPLKQRTNLPLDVQLTGYRKAHKDVIARVQSWVTWFRNEHGRDPEKPEIEEYAKTASFEIVSQLRRAAGLAKVDAAKELIQAHVDATGFAESGGIRRWNRPLIVWTHHLDVAAALLEALPQAEAIIGSTSDAARDSIVDRFQDGQIPVLVAAITKAGVGLTLTRSSDSIFVETDWTPALIVQAEDRTNRIGATQASSYTTLVALGTLDEAVQRVLARKSKVLAALGDNDSVNTMPEEDMVGLMEIAILVIEEAIRTSPRT